MTERIEGYKGKRQELTGPWKKFQNVQTRAWRLFPTFSQGYSVNEERKRTSRCERA